MAKSHDPARLAVVGLAAVAILLSALAPALTASAVNDGTLGIRPSNEADFFHLSVYPGAATEATAVVSNHTAEPVTLLTYPVDAISSEAGFAMADQTAPREGVAAWVRLAAGQVTVPANSEMEVPFRIDVPANTSPGDYAGAIIIQSPPVKGDTATVDGGTAVRMDVIQRQGVRIYLNVAGEAIAALDHGELTWNKSGEQVTFSVPVTNTGNTILHPSAELVVNDWGGGATKLDFTAPESLLPGATLILHAVLEDAPLVSVGSAQATIISETGRRQATTGFFYAPWELITAVLVGLAAALLGAWRVARFVRRARAALAQVGNSTAAQPEQQIPQTPGRKPGTRRPRASGGRHAHAKPSPYRRPWGPSNAPG